MKNYVYAAFGLAVFSIIVVLYCCVVKKPAPMQPSLECVVADSSGSFGCKDAGNFDSTCATATCPAGYTLTGGGGSCSAGDRKIKSLFPQFTAGKFTIACEQQGVAPQAHAICCKVKL
jgi:hypothetical protein